MIESGFVNLSTNFGNLEADFNDNYDMLYLQHSLKAAVLKERRDKDELDGDEIAAKRLK